MPSAKSLMLTRRAIKIRKKRYLRVRFAAANGAIEVDCGTNDVAKQLAAVLHRQLLKTAHVWVRPEGAPVKAPMRLVPNPRHDEDYDFTVRAWANLLAHANEESNEGSVEVQGAADNDRRDTFRKQSRESEISGTEATGEGEDNLEPEDSAEVPPLR